PHGDSLTARPTEQRRARDPYREPEGDVEARLAPPPTTATAPLLRVFPGDPRVVEVDGEQVHGLAPSSRAHDQPPGHPFRQVVEAALPRDLIPRIRRARAQQTRRELVGSGDVELR